MKTYVASLVIACGLLGILTGCSSRDSADDAIVAEGVIWSVEYKLEDGRTGGFTRVNQPAAVPGGNGEWNVDAYGRLTRDYLIITYPQRKGLGPRIIPADRLLDVWFGDAGVPVDENRPASAGST
jgi:hypothetical protein